MKSLDLKCAGVDLWTPGRLLLAMGTVFALYGCPAAPVNPGEWKGVELTNTTVMPSPTALTQIRRTRVVVLPSEDSPSAPAGAGLANVASASLETMLGAGGVEVIERKLAGRLDQELRLAEVKGAGSYGGPEVADYAIRVVMGTAGWKSTYVAASQFKNPLNGQTVTTPAGYTHTGQSNMTLRIYQLPSLRLIRSLPVEGSTSVSQQPYNATNVHAVGLVRGATDSGVKGKQSDVLNEFAPKGYVSERRIKEKEKESIFRVNLGKQTGAQPDEPVEFFALQAVKDLSGTETYDEILLGRGKMTNIVSETGSWVLVTDEKVARQVRRGDIVRVKAGRGRFGLPTSIGGIPIP